MRLDLLILFLLYVGSVCSQTTPGLPYSVSGYVKKTAVFMRMSTVDADVEIAKSEQEVIESREKIQQYGKALDVDLDILKSATVDTMPNGELVYQLGVTCPNALSINVVFDRFQLKMGSRLYIVGATSNRYIGAYTSLNNSEAAVLGTELVEDSKIIIELIEPKENRGSSKLHLGSVIHGYRSLEALIKRSFNTSGICNIDVNCPQGKGFEKQRNAVAMLINSTGGFCTGTLMNTTVGPFKPYVLSAFHCGTNPASWIFRFRWESPTDGADCGTSKPSVDGPKDRSINGASLVASYKSTDFILCELNASPASEWEVVYAGWDKSGAIPKSGTSIHHPIADIKKVSLDYKPLIAEAFNKGEPRNHWRTNWDQGITESGSSGSPLFDQNHRVVGQLHGGDSDCISKFLTDYYAKFSESWKGGGTPETRLSDWLDPVDAQVDFLDGSSHANYDPMLSYNASNLKGNLCQDSLIPYVIITNGGVDTLKSVSVQYAYDTGSLVEIKWSGKLALYARDTLLLPAMKFTKGAHVFTATLIPDSNFIDAEIANNSFSSTFTVLNNPRKYYLDLQLDTEGDENVWYLTDSTNKIWYKGGPYIQTLNKPMKIQEVFCLDPNCFTFSVYDFAGDGMYINDTNVGSYTLKDDSLKVVAQLLPENAKFASSSMKKFCYISNVEEVDFENQFRLYPNPSNLDIVHITAGNNLIKNIEVFTITGQLISSYTVNAQSYVVPISLLQAGMYYLRIIGESSETTKSFVRL
jgi:hypothetical protein